MARTFPVGPLTLVGRDNPLYVLPFDKHGRSTAPETLEHARTALRSGEFSDVFVFSHGWNNDWDAATSRYEHFAGGFVGQGADDPDRRALLLGLFWPSVLLVAPWEREPAMAGAPVVDAAEEELAGALTAPAAQRVTALARSGTLTDEQAAELAALLAPVYAGRVEELDEEETAPSPAALLESWRGASGPADDGHANGDWGTIDGGRGRAAPTSAGLLSKLDPRLIIRAASVWQMKDRAGRIGAVAAGPLIREALAATDARVNLVGHSFGGKVMLSALAAQPPARRAHSLLLLQAAVSHLCFADAVPGTGRPGGYRATLDRIERPVLSTYSARDIPLTRFFHLALRRRGDLGEPQIAAWPEPPSPYAALGGYGPRGADHRTQQCVLEPEGTAYVLDPDRPLAAVDATAGIAGHAAISNPRTWWALRELTT